MPVSNDNIKFFIEKIGERHSFKKKSSNEENPKALEPIVNDAMESITTNENYPVSKDLISDETKKMNH